MKLFSNGGNHAAEHSSSIAVADVIDRVVAWGKKPNAFTVNDCLKALAVVVWGIFLCWWMFTSSLKESGVELEPVVQTVTVEQTSPAPVAEPETVVTVDEALALAVGIDAVVSSVSGSEGASDVTMVMVGNVIMNRVEDSRYPGTIDQVLCQPYQFSCFSESGLKWVGRAATDPIWKQRCMDAAHRVLAGERLLSYGVVYVSGSKQGIVEAQLDGLFFCK